MSQGPRVTREKAAAVAEELVRRWGMAEHGVSALCGWEVVGSFRRGAAEVGDLEIVAPLPAGLPAKPAAADDPLFRRINETVINPWRDDRAPLFAPQEEPRATLGRIDKGLRPGFLAASLVVSPWEGVDLPVQVYRYTPQNRGWVTLMYTGPSAFGQWVLGRWKKAMGIPIGDDRYHASVDNHLVTSTGTVYPVATEEEIFRVIRQEPIHPTRRDEFMATLADRRALGRAML